MQFYLLEGEYSFDVHQAHFLLHVCMMDSELSPTSPAEPPACGLVPFADILFGCQCCYKDSAVDKNIRLLYLVLAKKICQQCPKLLVPELMYQFKIWTRELGRITPALFQVMPQPGQKSVEIPPFVEPATQAPGPLLALQDRRPFPNPKAMPQPKHPENINIVAALTERRPEAKSKAMPSIAIHSENRRLLAEWNRRRRLTQSVEVLDLTNDDDDEYDGFLEDQLRQAAAHDALTMGYEYFPDGSQGWADWG